jgi:hypothetical protein
MFMLRLYMMHLFDKSQNLNFIFMREGMLFKLLGRASCIK